MNQDKQLNIKTRSKVLEFSLVIEKNINNLLTYSLGMLGSKNKTKLFGNKGRITLQNKIDLLSDLGVLSKKENLDFELQMIIRNKFMHDLDCNSFQVLLNQLDNGIVNRFKKHLEEGKLISNEDACLDACANLAINNAKIIQEKIRLQTDINHKKIELFESLNKELDFLTDHYFNLFKNIQKAILTSGSKEPENIRLNKDLLAILEESFQKVDNELKQNNINDILDSEYDLNSIFGIRSKNRINKKANR